MMIESAPYQSLPADVSRICDAVQAPPRLIAHLILVHDAAHKLFAELQNAFPGLQFDAGAIIFGAATHDIGKAVHPNELIEPGKQHETCGADLLLKLGIPEQYARFAFTHGNWNGEPVVEIEDLLVALADNCWKGKRVDELESKLVTIIASETGKPDWECFIALDEILSTIAADADARLSWQAQFPVHHPVC